MRKIVVLTMVSLDGVMQAPGGPEEDTSGGFNYGGWTVPYVDESLGNTINEELSVPLFSYEYIFNNSVLPLI